MNGEFLEGWRDGVRAGCRALASPEIEHLFLTEKFPLIVAEITVDAAKKAMPNLIIDKDVGATYSVSGFIRGVWFVITVIEDNEIAFVSDDAARQVRNFVSRNAVIKAAE